MRRLKPLILLLATVTFMASCSKNPEPPALGDHTVDIGDKADTGKGVLSLGANWGNIFQTGPKGILYVRNTGNIIKVYTPDDKGVFGIGTPFPGDPWEASANIYYMGVAQGVETVMVTNVPPAGLFRFDADANGLLSIHPTTNAADPWPTNFGFWYGDGWDNYDIIAFNGKFVFQISHNEGEALLRSDFGEFTDDWSTWNRPGTLHRDDVGKKFDGYRSAFAMENDLIIVTKDGDLMAYAVDNDGNLDDGTKVGTGWKAYDRIVATGKDILAIDSKGNVSRYTIDLKRTDNNANP
jgi:hypothetical protein